MNREILFKAKRVDNGEWDYGYLFKNSKGICYILSESIETADIDIIEIIPETISQYTDLKNKNGKKIFENDIIEYKLQNHKTYEIYYETFTVEWNKETASYTLKNDNKILVIDYVTTYGEVIGSIHDREEVEEVC